MPRNHSTCIDGEACRKNIWVTLRACLAVVLLAITFSIKLSVPSHAEAPALPLNILLISAWHEEMPWQTAFLKGLKSGLKASGRPHRLFIEHMDAGRFKAEAQESIVLPYIKNKYRTQPIDVILVESLPAVRMFRQSNNFKPGARRLYIQSGAQLNQADRANSIAAAVDYDRAVAEMVRMAAPKRIFVIGDTEDSPGQKRLKALETALSKEASTIPVEYLTDVPVKELQSVVTSLPKNSAIFALLLFNKAGDGAKMTPKQAASAVAKVATAPVFTAWETILGDGVVGGYLLSSENIGRMAAQAIWEPFGLSGSSELSPHSYIYDWRQLMRWGFTEAELPPNAIIRFHELTFYEKYRWQLATVVFSILVLSMLSGALAIANRNRQKAYERLDQQKEELTQAYRHVKESKEQFKATFDQAAVGITHIAPNGRWLRVNDRFCEITGYTREELQDMTFESITYPEDIDNDRVARSRLQRGVIDTYTTEKRYIRKGGSVTWVQVTASVARDEHGAEKYVIAVFADINRLKRAEDELKQREAALSASEAILRKVVNIAPIAKFVIDNNGRVLFCNKFMASLCGMEPEELEGKTIGAIERIITIEELETNGPLKRGTPDRNGMHVMPQLLVDHAGNRHIMHTTRKSLDWFGVPAELTAATDMTEYVELEKKRYKAEAMAEAKSLFLANMSHEIRTPMNAILGFVYLLTKPDKPRDVRELATKILRAGNTLQTIINDILDFSKIEAGKIEIRPISFTLNDILENISSIMAANAIEKKVELLISPHFDVFKPLWGDKFRLAQILINIVGNALKFTHEGYVKLEIVPLEQSDDDVTLMFKVVDTGIGMSPEQQGKMLESFEQGHLQISRSYGGTGLGLAICSRLLELMGSSLSCVSKENAGSEFSFELVLKFDRSADYATPELTNLNVLLADDQDLTREALELVAKSLTWKPVLVKNGAEAVQSALEMVRQKTPPDAIILDLDMPELGGLEACRAIKERTGLDGTPIILMTSSASRENLLGRKDFKCIDAILEKPITPSALHDQVLELKKPSATHQISRPSCTNLLNGKNILVVDDNELNRDVAYQILNDEGATVECAESGQQAFDLIERSAKRPDLILMDVEMPGMDGYQATRSLRESSRYGNIPIVALTAGALESQKEKALEAGMDDFIAKPFEVEQLLKLVCRYTGQAYSDANQRNGNRERSRQPSHYRHLDVNKALSLWKDEAKLAKYYEKFIYDYRNCMSTIESLPAGEAAHYVHKLKGAAGVLGFSRFTQLVESLEHALMMGGSAQELLDAMRDEIGFIDREVQAFVSSVNLTNKTSPPKKREDAPDKDALLKQLQQALQEDDLEAAEDLIREFETYFDVDEVMEISKALESFDLREALKLAHGLMARPNHETPSTREKDE